MNKHNKRKFTPKFKFMVAFKALQEKQTLAEIASKYELHASQISDWKQQVLTSGGGLFESDKLAKVFSTKADNPDKLYEQIGRLQVEKTFLKKSHRELQHDSTFGNDSEPPVRKTITKICPSNVNVISCQLVVQGFITSLLSVTMNWKIL
jgi:transposase